MKTSPVVVLILRVDGRDDVDVPHGRLDIGTARLRKYTAVSAANKVDLYRDRYIYNSTQ